MSCFSKLFTFIALLFISFSSFAQSTTTSSTTTNLDGTTTTVVEKKTIVSPTPTAVCESVPGRWEGDVWVAAHNICKYQNRAEGVAWVSEYWSCTAATADGTCTSWSLVPGHWVQSLP